MLTPPPGFSLRPASNADSPAVINLVFSILRSYRLSPDPADTDADLADIEAHYHRRGGSFDLLLDSSTNQIIGTVALDPTDPTTAELRKMYLSPAYRRRGLGRFLLQHALHQARHQGFHRVWLQTNSVLHEALTLYRNAGFRPCPSPHLPQRANLAMDLLLSPPP